jgi:hypothetical protein
MATISDKKLLPSIAVPAYQYNCYLPQSEYTDDHVSAATFPQAPITFFRRSMIFNFGVAEMLKLHFSLRKAT